MNIRLITPGEEEQCNDLRNNYYGESRTLKQWRWEYADNTYRVQPTPYAVAEHEGAIVGTQAFIPVRFIDRDGVFWTAKSEGTLVDPRYRGQGIFANMYALLFDYALHHGFACIWGFTTAVNALTPLGFYVPGRTEQILFPFSMGVVPALLGQNPGGRRDPHIARPKDVVIKSAILGAKALSVLKLALRSSCKSGDCEIRTLDSANEQCGDVCRDFIEKWGGVTIYRDREYIAWRHLRNPYVRSVMRAAYDGNRLLGWVAFALGDDGLAYLVDLIVTGRLSLSDTEGVVRRLLIEAVYGARNMGATAMRGWRVNDHPFDKLICSSAKSIGFYHVKKGHSAVWYDCDAGRNRASQPKFDTCFISRVFTEGVLG